MGYRYITQTEYDFIRELIKKNKGDITKVKVICGRSYSSLQYIKASSSFKNYIKIRPGKHQDRKAIESRKNGHAKPVQMKLAPARDTEANKPTKDYSGAILAEMARLRHSIDEFNKRCNYPLIKVESTEPTIAPLLDQPEVRETAPSGKNHVSILTVVFYLVLIGFAAFVFFTL